MAARKKSGGPNKSAFIRGVLEKNKGATAKDAQEAWKAAGNKDKLNPSLFYNLKGKMSSGGKKKKRRGRPPKAAASETSSGSNVYLSIEKSLDGLIAKAEEARDGKLAEALRSARRRASAKLV